MTRLERRYPEFDGLNLTWETLEGIAKHNGPVADRRPPFALAEFDAVHDLGLDTQPAPRRRSRRWPTTSPTTTTTSTTGCAPGFSPSRTCAACR